MTFAALAKLKKNSVPTTLSSGITAVATTIPVTELSRFYDSDGVLITEGIVIGGDNANSILPEEITITGASGSSGAGNLTGVTRGVNSDGAIGAGYAWSAGTNIGVTFTTGIHNKIKANFEALRTAAAKSIYVDAAATGAGDGTSWTNAFTTIQAAINSLPTALEHTVTIYIRKGATAYAETLTIQQLTGKGSVMLRGEYYWNGRCAAATTPGTTKFKTAAHTDGANIAVGDRILVTSALGGAGEYDYFVVSTVKSVVDKGSNVYEIELNAAADWGNISNTDYYTIIKTELASVISITNVGGISLLGLYDSITTPITLTRSTLTELAYCILIGSNFTVYSTLSIITNIRNCYVYTSNANRSTLAAFQSSIMINSSQNAAGATVFSSAATSTSYAAIQAATGASIYCYGAILKGVATTGTGLLSKTGGFIETVYTCIVHDTGTGLRATYNGTISVGAGNNNNATTPKTPASATDAAYIT
jgi:hypothetical protein